jgi:hypothetical protein
VLPDLATLLRRRRARPTATARASTPPARPATLDALTAKKRDRQENDDEAPELRAARDAATTAKPPSTSAAPTKRDDDEPPPPAGPAETGSLAEQLLAKKKLKR